MRLVGRPLVPPRFPTVAHALQQAAQTSKGLYLVDGRREDTFLSFADIDDDARKVASSLSRRGVRPDDRVVICLPTSRDFLAAFFGAQYAGAVPVPVAPVLRMGKNDDRLRTLGDMLRSIQARVLVAEPAFIEILSNVASTQPGCECVPASELLNTPHRLLIEPQESTIGVIQFSSGSTSFPKPVALLHANLLAQLSALETMMRSVNSGVSWLPMYHDMGLIGGLLSSVYQAGPLALLTPDIFLMRPAIWLRSIAKYSAGISAGPTFAYRHCLSRIRDADLEGVDLSSWKIALCGGDVVSADVMRQFANRFSRYGFDPGAFRPAYGLAESSLAVTSTVNLKSVRVVAVDPNILASDGRVQPPIDVVREIVSAGTPVCGAQVEIRDAEGKVLEPGIVGSVWTSSPSVMSGYFKNVSATDAVLRDGWLDTGDLGFIDDEELFICGRKKDIVIINGSNHSPTEFEDCLNDIDGLPAGLVAVAIGFIPPSKTEEELLLIVERAYDASDDLAERVMAAVLDKTGIKPHAVHLVDRGTLPRTSSGKLRRAHALQKYLTGQFESSA